jgi:peptide/nickel transport system permease protein
MTQRKQVAAEITSALAESSEILTPGRIVWRRFRKSKLAVLGSIILLFLIVVAFAAPLLTTHDPNYINMGQFRRAPSENHLLGTDSLGRDVWARLVYGSRVSLSVGLVSVSIILLIGVTFGSIAGYFGGLIDDGLMRFTEVIMAFPAFLFTLTLIAALDGQGNIFLVMLVLGILGWPGVARLVRGEFLTLREREFVLSAKTLGASHARILFKHILPNAMAPVIVVATLSIAGSILAEAGLSFIGMGAGPNTPSWGSMLSEANSRLVLQRYPWLWVPPGLAILITVLSISFVGDGLRDALDPRMKE